MIKDYFGGSQVNRAPELPAATSGYIYTTSAGKATITGYSGVGGELIIPATLGGYPVVAIANNAFQNHVEITSVTVPEFVTTIGSSAFRGCTAMDWITIGANVTTIGPYAFEGCADLTLITFLGRTAPTVTDGASTWIDNTPTTIRGQALATSSFLPNSDKDHKWNGLSMGVLMPVDKNPVSTVVQLTGANSNTYRFTTDLALAGQDPWINGQNHYTLNYNTFKTATAGQQEQYYLGKVIYISGPFQTLDIVTAGASIGDHHRHLADSNNAVQYYLNDDNWQDPYAVATYVDDGRSHHWSAPEGSISTIGDINGDGKADIIAILYDNAALKETETSLNIYINDDAGNWPRTIIAMLPYGSYPTALTLGNADLDGDLDIFVAFSFTKGKHHVSLTAIGSVGVYLNDGAWTYEEITYSDAPIKYISVGDLDVNQGTNIAGCSFDVLVGFDRVGTGAAGAFVIYKNYNHMGHDWDDVPISFSDGTSPKEARGVLIADMDSTWKNEIVLLDLWQQVWIGSYDLSSNTATAARIPSTATSNDPNPRDTLSYGLGTGVVIGKRGERLQDIVVTVSSWSKISSKVYMTTIDITVLNQIALNTFSKEALADELFYFNEEHHHDRDRTNPTTMVVADIDGNGLADILLGGSDGEIRLLENIKGSTDASSWMPIQVDMGSEGFGWTQTSVVASLSVGNIHGGTTIGPVVVPGVPDLSVTPSNVQVALSWSGPAIDGGSPITHYRLYRSTTTSTGTYTMISSFSGGIQNYVDTDVFNGHTYWYRISAVNAMGEGAQCAPISALPAPQKPSSPTGLSAIASGNSVSLSWVAPSNDGGSSVTGYRIYRSTPIEGVYSLIAPQPLITITSFGGSATDTGLINSQTYWYKVSAVNEKGEGVTSASASAKIPARAPDAPTGLAGVHANKKVTLTWVAPLYNGGADIDYYLVYVNGDVQSTHYTSLTAAISSLNNGTPYTFTVVAHNSAGFSDYSNVISETPHN